jgi:hypothetical protein
LCPQKTGSYENRTVNKSRWRRFSLEFLTAAFSIPALSEAIAPDLPSILGPALGNNCD